MSVYKKIIIGISCLIVLVIAVILVTRKNTKPQDIITSNNTIEQKKTADVKYDNETGLYYIINPDTNEIVAASTEESRLQFYKDNPDYRPNPDIVNPTNIKDYYYQMIREEIENSD